MQHQLDVKQEDIHPISKPNYNFQNERRMQQLSRENHNFEKKKRENSTLDITLIIEETGENLR